LKIDGPVLDLDDDVAVEFAIEPVEVVVGGLGAFISGIGWIVTPFVDKAAVEEQAAVGLEGAGDHVRGVGVSALVCGRSYLPFRISLYYEAGKIGDCAVDFIGFALPPLGDARVQWIERIQSTDALRAPKIDGQRKPHAPGAKRGGHTRQLRQEVRREHPRVGVDVVDGAAVDAKRSQQAPVVSDSGQIVANRAAGKENGMPRITSFNRSLQVVPLVDPTHRRMGLLNFIDSSYIFAEGDLSQQGKGPVEDTSIGIRRNQQATKSTHTARDQPETIGLPPQHAKSVRAGDPGLPPQHAKSMRAGDPGLPPQHAKSMRAGDPGLQLSLYRHRRSHVG